MRFDYIFSRKKINLPLTNHIPLVHEDPRQPGFELLLAAKALPRFPSLDDCILHRVLHILVVAKVKSILHDETYIGNTVHNKQSNISYKNKRRIRKPEAEWVRVEGTHEAIIDKDVFVQVQEQMRHRRRQMKDATTQIFAGMLRCADCGWSMSFGTNKQSLIE